MATQKILNRWMDDFEAGNLDFKDSLTLFSYLIRTGKILDQGPAYQVKAIELIAMGLLGPDGFVQVSTIDPETAIKGQG